MCLLFGHFCKRFTNVRNPFLNFFHYFMWSFQLISACIFNTYFSLLALGLTCSSFSSFLSLDNLRCFFFSNICIYWFKFPSKSCFSCILQFWYIVLNSFNLTSFLLWVFLWPMGYLELCCLFSKHSGIFQISLNYWSLV